jgi:hypothetical protein
METFNHSFMDYNASGRPTKTGSLDLETQGIE